MHDGGMSAMQIDYWSKAREGRLDALNALHRLAERPETDRTPRPPALGKGVPADHDDLNVALPLRLVGS